MTMSFFILAIALPVLMVAIALAFIRFLRGPSLPDRVVALDLLATFGIGVVGLYAIFTNQPAFIDVALVFALLVFLGTVAFAYYIETRERSV